MDRKARKIMHLVVPARLSVSALTAELFDLRLSNSNKSHYQS